MRNDQIWPQLSYAHWRDTIATLQLWTQIVGKIRLSLSPWLNHGWQVPFYVTARGLGTSPIPIGNEIFEIEFDFVGHCLAVRDSRGRRETLALEPQSVAEFHQRVTALLGRMDIPVAINEMPNELTDPIRFPEDTVHATYDAAAVHRFWRALIQADRIFKLFRSGFLGKASPVHFFWVGLILPLRGSQGGAPRSIPGAYPDFPMPSPAKPIRTR